MKPYHFVLIVIMALLIGGSLQKLKCDTFFPDMNITACMLLVR